MNDLEWSDEQKKACAKLTIDYSKEAGTVGVSV